MQNSPPHPPSSTKSSRIAPYFRSALPHPLSPLSAPSPPTPSPSAPSVRACTVVCPRPLTSVPYVHAPSVRPRSPTSVLSAHVVSSTHVRPIFPVRPRPPTSVLVRPVRPRRLVRPIRPVRSTRPAPPRPSRPYPSVPSVRPSTLFQRKKRVYPGTLPIQRLCRTALACNSARQSVRAGSDAGLRHQSMNTIPQITCIETPV